MDYSLLLGIHNLDVSSKETVSYQVIAILCVRNISATGHNAVIWDIIFNETN